MHSSSVRVVGRLASLHGVLGGQRPSARKYYYAGSVRVAMRDNGTLYFLLSDHLGSTNLTLDSSGNRLDPNAELVSVSRWGHAGGQNGALRSVKGSKKRPPPAHNGFEPTREKGYTVPS